MRYVIYSAILALSGCVSVPAQMDKGLSNMVGSNIKWAVAILGYPAGKREMMGQTIYTWSTSSQGAFVMPTITSTTGYVGTTPYSATTQTPMVVPLNFNCTIEIMTDEKDIIRSFQWSGNRGGCRRYAEVLPPA